MKYIYRDITVFEYINGDVIQHKTDGVSNFDCCRWTAEACKELELKDMGEWKPMKRGRK